jgi:hypothetical protein
VTSVPDSAEVFRTFPSKLGNFEICINAWRGMYLLTTRSGGQVLVASFGSLHSGIRFIEQDDTFGDVLVYFQLHPNKIQASDYSKYWRSY